VFFRVNARRDTIVWSYKKTTFPIKGVEVGGGVKIERKKKKCKRKRVFQKPESPPAGVR